MRMTNWPKEDRPREKLIQKGEQQLTDAELIAIFINTGTRGKTALDLAKELLSEFGSLKKLLQAPAHRITQKMGMGQAKYAALRAGLELGKRYFAETITTGELINSTARTQQFLQTRLGDRPIELFACLFMDTHLRLISYEELFSGTINFSHIYIREIVRRALLHNAAKLILAHNHPSGIAAPSEADIDVTNQIKIALNLVDITVVDHIIIGNDQHFSFASAGWI